MGDDTVLTVQLELSEPFGTEQERAAIVALEKHLERVLAETGVGTVDGHGFGTRHAELFLIGANRTELTFTVEREFARLEIPPHDWEILPSGDETSDISAQLPDVLVRPVSVPPSWHSASEPESWYELQAGSDGDTPRVPFRLLPIRRSRPGVRLLRESAAASPIVSCSPPGQWPNGRFQPWVVRLLERRYVSLYLPDWLLDAPSSSLCSLQSAREELDNGASEEAAFRRIHQNLLGIPTTLPAALADEPHTAGQIHWWHNDQPTGNTPYTSSAELLEVLDSEANATRPRQHLITGIRRHI